MNRSVFWVKWIVCLSLIYALVYLSCDCPSPVEPTPNKIPEGIVILWDDAKTSPDNGWTEIQIDKNRLIYFDGSTGKEGGDGGHYHTLQTTLNQDTEPVQNAGDGGGTTVNQRHTHKINISTDAVDVYPNVVFLKAYIKNDGTQISDFPPGAIVGYGGENIPQGWSELGWDGYYPCLTATDTIIGKFVKCTDKPHSHHWSGITSACDAGYEDDDGLNPNFAPPGHTHTVSGITESENVYFELKSLRMHFIKRQDSKTSKYDTSFYVLYNSNIVINSGWIDVTGNYPEYYLRGTANPMSEEEATTSSHSHAIPNGVSSMSNEAGNGQGGYHHQAPFQHTHTWDRFQSFSATIDESPWLSLRLLKKS